MPDISSRRGAVEMGTVLMILAFAVIGGFLYWLNGQAAAERALRLVVDETPVEDTTPSGVETIMPEEIQLDASPFEGRELRLESVNVASMLGTQGFWLEMPNGNPFLVSMSSEVMAAGVGVAAGSPATVTGVMHAMNDSTLTAWTEAQTIGENDRIIAEFATHFIEASDVVVGGAGAGSSGN